jgi:GMP synthase-like glutamine amidotransferase
MKPVAIFRHVASEGPGYFATFLERHRVPWRVVRIDEGEAVPSSARDFSGLVFMGGPMSVNDDLPWIAPALRLIRSAADAGMPVLGHVSGDYGEGAGRGDAQRSGNRMGPVAVLRNPVAEQWLGAGLRPDSFHWHGETFSIPPGRAPVSDRCEPAFALGPHLDLSATSR